MAMRIPIAVLLSVLAWSVPSSAHAKQFYYVGAHPVGDDAFCYIEAPHVHKYEPGKKHKVLYREHGDHRHFVGDPVAHRYDGPRHRYHGHHPIAAASYIHAGDPDDGEFFCYIDGPHFHAYAPAPSLRFKVAGDAYWYAGPVPDGYAEAKVEFAPMTRFYARVHYPRPVIEVEPPVGYAFATVVAPGVVVTAPGVVADVDVVGPDVEIEVPAEVSIGAGVSAGVSAGIEVRAPTLEVEIGGPAVIVEGGVGHRHRHGKGHWKPKKHKARHKKGRYRNPHRRDFRR